MVRRMLFASKTRPSFRRVSRSDCAFTLVEVLIVLSLLLVILTVSWPSVMRYNQKQQLKQSAMVIQTQLSAARMRAIENSTAFEFSYQRSGRRYSVTPALKTNAIVLPGSMTKTVATAFETIVSELPSGIVFAEHDGAPGRGSDAKWINVNGEDWSVPVVFYPDGTSDQSDLILLDKSGQLISIKIRGLTGMVKVGRLRKA